MKPKKKKIFAGIIASLTFVSSILVIIPVITHYLNNYSKNSIKASTTNSYSTIKLSNSTSYLESSNILVNNLTYINKYINSTLIIKEKLLRLSILGGKYDNTIKYKNDKKKKRSELAQFSHSLKHVHRYVDQVAATIDNSTTSLKKESSVISQIIPIIMIHSYTYSFYLNKMKISIPNISFFINKNTSFSSNYLNYKINNISNSSYGAGISSTNLNSIVFSSEEAGAGGKTMYKVGSSIYAAAFTKISFQANIITFDETTNSFKYEVPTSKVIKISKTPSRTRLDSDNSEILNGNSNRTNSSSYFNSSRTALSSLNSLNNALTQNLPNPLTPNYLPDYFNTQLSNAAEAKINYNHISSFKNNHSLYYPAIFVPTVINIFSNIIFTIMHTYVGLKTKKLQIKITADMDARLIQISQDIYAKNITTKEQFYSYLNDMNARLDAFKNDIKRNPFTYDDKLLYLDLIQYTRGIYNERTAQRAIELKINPTADDVTSQALFVATPKQIRKKNKIISTIATYNANLNSGMLKDTLESKQTELELIRFISATRNSFNKYKKKIECRADFIAEADKQELLDEIKKCNDSFFAIYEAKLNTFRNLRFAKDLDERKSNKIAANKSIIEFTKQINDLDEIYTLNRLERIVANLSLNINQNISDIEVRNYPTEAEKSTLVDEARNLHVMLINKKTQRTIVIKNNKIRRKVLTLIDDKFNEIEEEMTDSQRAISDIQEVHDYMKMIEARITNIIKTIEFYQNLTEDKFEEFTAKIHELRKQYQTIGDAQVIKIQKNINDEKEGISEALKEQRNNLKAKEKVLNGDNAPTGDSLKALKAEIHALKNKINNLQHGLNRITENENKIKIFAPKKLRLLTLDRAIEKLPVDL